MSSISVRRHASRNLVTGLVFSVILLTAPQCTDAGLEALPTPPAFAFDNHIAVSGEVCTEAPQDLVYPLRVLFLVDCSESMAINDPPDPQTGETGRERAVRETVESLLSSGYGTAVSVVRFSAEAQPLTVETAEDGTFESYFTSDLDLVLANLPALAETDRTTNYINALSEAYAEVRDELVNADQASLALSTYHVILLSDGIPDAESTGQGANTTDNILDAVGALEELGDLFHVGRLTVSTALLASGDLEADAAAEDLLAAMADEGGGSYRAFSSGEDLNFLFVDLSVIRRVFTLRTLVAENVNRLTIDGETVPDSDGDGLSDADEALAGSDPTVPDTDGDGCRDGIEQGLLDLGFDPSTPGDCACLLPDDCQDADGDGACDNGCQDADQDGLCDCTDADGNGVCDPANYPDTDGDGLVDCEERYSGTNSRGADTDGDGLMDFQELRFGTSPEANDIDDDPDWDAVPTGEEVRTGTDPHHANPEGRASLAYRYQIRETTEDSTGQTCYTFRIDNIALEEVVTASTPTTGPAGQGYSGRNRILIYAGEVPFDDLESYARFRVACVEAWVRRDGNYRDPPSGQIRVTDADFVTLDTFDAPTHCLPPGGHP